MRRRRPVFSFEFIPPDLDAVLDWMHRLDRFGEGWINLLPGVPEGLVEEPNEGFFGSLFGVADPPVAMCTWMPAPPASQDQTIGIAHARRTKARVRLAEVGMDVPSAWRRSQDNPRRGLVAHPRAEVPRVEVLSWLIGAGGALSVLPLSGKWQARVFLPYNSTEGN